MSRSSPDKPAVFATEGHLILVLDDRGPRDTKGNARHLRDDRPLEGEPLRFSVTRGGRLKFAQKVHCRAQTEVVDVLDEEGNQAPNPAYEDEMARYGRSVHKPHKREKVTTDEPFVELSYHVDPNWWIRHAHTKVCF